MLLPRQQSARVGTIERRDDFLTPRVIDSRLCSGRDACARSKSRELPRSLNPHKRLQISHWPHCLKFSQSHHDQQANPCPVIDLSSILDASSSLNISDHLHVLSFATPTYSRQFQTPQRLGAADNTSCIDIQEAVRKKLQSRLAAP